MNDCGDLELLLELELLLLELEPDLLGPLALAAASPWDNGDLGEVGAGVAGPSSSWTWSIGEKGEYVGKSASCCDAAGEAKATGESGGEKSPNRSATSESMS